MSTFRSSRNSIWKFIKACFFIVCWIARLNTEGCSSPSIIESYNCCDDAMFKRAIQQTIKKQALINFQIGLRDDLKVLVRSQRYTTLQEAINGASAEEKLLGPQTARNNNFANKNKSDYSRQTRSPTQCYKCGKTGHYGRDCRSSKYALPKPDKSSRVNVINKHCNHCKKSGHNRDECWSLNGRPKANSNRSKDDNKKISQRSQKNRSDSSSSSSSEEEHKKEKKKAAPPALEYRVAHIRDKAHRHCKPKLRLVTLPIRQVKGKLIDVLCDSGSAISLIKLKYLKDDTPVHPEKIALIGITGDKLYTLGKAYLTIKTDEFKLKHAFYVIRDDTPIEHDGILGIDFLNEHAVCNFPKSEIKIGNTIFKLHSQRTVTLKPRSETIIQAVTRRNRTGIVHAEEHVPGVYIGNCLVEAKDYTCPISMINTTDKEICIPLPRVKIEKVEDDNPTEMYMIQTAKNIKPKASR